MPCSDKVAEVGVHEHGYEGVVVEERDVRRAADGGVELREHGRRGRLAEVHLAASTHERTKWAHEQSSDELQSRRGRRAHERARRAHELQKLRRSTEGLDGAIAEGGTAAGRPRCAVG